MRPRRLTGTSKSDNPHEAARSLLPADEAPSLGERHRRCHTIGGIAWKKVGTAEREHSLPIGKDDQWRIPRHHLHVPEDPSDDHGRVFRVEGRR